MKIISSHLSWILSLLVLLLTLGPSAGSAATLRIDPNLSVVHTTFWTPYAMALEVADDIVDLNIAGTFEVLVQEDGLMNFRNIDVITTTQSDRTFTFPEYPGLYYGPSFAGSEDDCFLFFSYYQFSGSCWSAGNFGSYTGTFDGQTLHMTGGKDGWFTTSSQTNSFIYDITAYVVPIPGAFILFLSGVSSILLYAAKLSRKKS